jgi:hypothetical protein
MEVVPRLGTVAGAMGHYNDSRTDDEWVDEIRARTGLDAIDARFLLAIERGEVDGDVIVLDEVAQP